MINNIKDNTISEADSKKKINELNETKNVEIKGKRLIKSEEKLLSFFDDLVEAISNDNSSNDNNNNNNNSNNNNNHNESNNKNKSKNENENVNENENESENESWYESDNENEKDEYYYEIRQLNNWFETTDQTKPLEEQLKLLKERGEFLSEYWNAGYYLGNKELNY